MIPNSRYASNFVAALALVFLLLALIPDDALPTWALIILGGAIGYYARKTLLARLNAQSKQRV